MAATQSLEWTPERLARFWDYCTQAPGARQQYFTRQYAPGIARFMAEIAPLPGLRVLDHGSGPGDLTDELLAAGAIVTASDCAPASIAMLQGRCQHRAGWRGAVLTDGSYLPLRDETFDAVCCIETIEHVLDCQLDSMLGELRRVLRRGGFALFTTPDDEQLTLNTVFCPNCSSEFHRWQHVRSWNRTGVTETLRRHGFDVVFCRPISFSWFQSGQARQSWKDISPRRAAAAARRFLDRFGDLLRPREFPARRAFARIVTRPGGSHLTAVGIRR
jgi:ubiquinone/menaquinone biosynthesis C-methylase UbiE